MAEREVGVDRHTIAKKLAECEILPGEDGYYSTRQIFRCLSGDIEKSRARKEAAAAALAEMEEAEKRGTLIEVEWVKLTWSQVLSGVKQRILGMPSKLQSRLGLSREQVKGLQDEIDEALSELSKPQSYRQPGRRKDDGDGVTEDDGTAAEADAV